MIFLCTQFYKNVEENILNPILDPYVPKEFLVFRPTEKIKLNLGKFLINLGKTLFLAYLSFQIFLLTEPYFKTHNSWIVRITAFEIVNSNSRPSNTTVLVHVFEFEPNRLL